MDLIICEIFFMRGQQMSLTQTHAQFEDTSYTLIGALKDEHKAEFAASELTRLYWPPVYSFLRHSGKNRDQAAEITQGFFYDKVLRLKFFERANPEDGRLRNLILTALKNYMIDEHRKEVVRGKGQLITLDSIIAEDQSADYAQLNQNPIQAFNARWASIQLDEAMRRCEDHFRSSGRDGHWEAFANRIYHPTIFNTTPTPLKELAPALGFATAADAASAVQLVKKRVLSFLREVVAESTDRPDLADLEFGEIMGMLQAA